MDTPQEGTVLIEREDEAPAPVPFAMGEVVVFSARGPGKTVNEDAAAVLPYGDGGLLLVADGMGGQNAGERASRLTVETVARRLAEGEESGEPLRHAVLDGIDAANHAVLGMGVGAGTTLAAVLLREGRARAVHVGDSVVMHLGQRGSVKAATVPHSPTGYAVEAGLLDEADALHHEDRHLVSNHVGMPDMRIEVGASIPVARRDTLVVASDGLADNLTPEEIVEIARKGPLLGAAAELARRARERMADTGPERPGQPDDLTLVLFRRRG